MPGPAPGRGAAGGIAPGRGAAGRGAFAGLMNGLLPAGRWPGARGGAAGEGADGAAGAAGAADAAWAGGAAGVGAGAIGVGTATGGNVAGGATGAAAAGTAIGAAIGAGVTAGALAAGAATVAAAGGAGGAFTAPLVGNASLSLRTTGASTVEDALLTNSPWSFNHVRSALLSIPNSLASSWTRALPATVLLISAGGDRTAWLPGSAHRNETLARTLIACSMSSDASGHSPVQKPNAEALGMPKPNRSTGSRPVRSFCRADLVLELRTHRVDVDGSWDA
jgi:hypothetical protein